MHSKQDSDGGTSTDTSWTLRSPPPRRPLYYVQSPNNNNHDYVDKMSYGSSPMGSPPMPNMLHSNNNNNYNYFHYHCSPVHHSRESSTTTRFSAGANSLSVSAWKHMHLRNAHHSEHDEDNDDDDDDDDDDIDGGGGGDGRRNLRVYVSSFLAFVAFFTIFSFILWAASKTYTPKITVKNIVLENLIVQAGTDQSGVATDMLSINSTVKILYRNPATFFAVHVTSTPWELYYYQLRLGVGQMHKFTQSRKSEHVVVTIVDGHQVPLYGGVSIIRDRDVKNKIEKTAIPMNLTFVMRSRAYILGRLVKSTFHTHITCSLTLRGNKLGIGNPLNLTHSCTYC